MKKFLLSLAVLCTLGAGQASAIKRVPKPGWTNQVNFGMTVANLRGWGSDPKVGYDASLLFECMIKGGKGTYVNFGPEFSMQGCKTGDDKLRTHYLTVPIHLGFRYMVSRKVGLNIEFGPYFGVGLGGKYDYKHGGSAQWFADDDHKGWDANRFDCGLGIRLGGEYKQKFSLNFGFNWGLTECEPRALDLPNHKKDWVYDDVKTFTSTITFGYRF